MATRHIVVLADLSDIIINNNINVQSFVLMLLVEVRVVLVERGIVNSAQCTVEAASEHERGGFV